MTEKIFKKIRDNIDEIMEARDNEFTPKQLAEKSKISYSTLAPILRGERDFRISNLVALAEALGTTPNEILNGLYKNTPIQIRQDKVAAPKYYFTFLTDVGLTYCRFTDLTTGNIETRLFPFSLFCTNNSKQTVEQLRNAIYDIAGDIEITDVYVYLSILAYEHVDGRLRLIEELRSNFTYYLMEPDWMPIHHSLLNKKDGILITINNGYAISYSNDGGKTLKKIQGYSFPISDEAGNFWLGCEAIKHAINVKEGIEQRSMLSDKVLSLVNSDLNLLATKAYDHQREFFVEVATIVKELSNKKDMAYRIVKKGFDNIWERVKGIDEKLGKKLPVFLAGALAYLYEEFVPEDRLIQINFENTVDDQLTYANQKLEEAKEQLLNNR